MRIRGWLTGLIVFLLVPSVLFATLWYNSKFEDVAAIERSLNGLNFIQALAPLVKEKAVSGKLEQVPSRLRQDLIEFGGSEQAKSLTIRFDIFLNEPDPKTSLGYAQELSQVVSQLAKLDAAVSYESSALPDLVNTLLFPVIIESSKMTDNARRLVTRRSINVWEKMLVTVQGGRFKSAADSAALQTTEYLDDLPGKAAVELRNTAQQFRKANFVFQSQGSKLLKSAILAKTGNDIDAVPVIEAHPELVNRTFELWQASLDYLNQDLQSRRKATLSDVVLAGLIGGLVIFAAFCIAVALSRSLAQRTIKEFENLGFHDPLTGLPNRRALLKAIKTLPTPEPHLKTGLMVIDLRQFKKINDRFGDSAGDSTLRELASQLTQYLEPEDFLSRTGGTEFTLLRPNIKFTADFEKFAEKLLQEISGDRTIGDQTATLEYSAGLFVSQQGVRITDQGLIDVALSLRAAKEKGAGNCELFKPEMRAHFETSGETAKELLSAIHAGEIVTWFQPQIDIRTNEVVGCEALVRWLHNGKVKLPGAFLPAAIEAGYMDLVDSVVLEHTLQFAARLSGRTPKPIHFSINVTTSLLTSTKAVNTLHDRVRHHGLEPSNISIELLEAVMIDEVTAAPIKENIARLAEFGFYIELDDFGTGHSSISSLRDLKVDRVKIDRSFVAGVDTNLELQKFTSALINLAKSLDISVLAEGVETEGERTWLKAHGCDAVQGFLISEAIPEKLLTELIMKQNFTPPRIIASQAVAVNGQL